MAFLRDLLNVSKSVSNALVGGAETVNNLIQSANLQAEQLLKESELKAKARQAYLKANSNVIERSVQLEIHSEYRDIARDLKINEDKVTKFLAESGDVTFADLEELFKD